mgnify:CR=1 FL=1|jgi:hypothetical protein
MLVRRLSRACKLVVANTVGSAGTVRNSTSTERNGQRQIASKADAINTRTTDHRATEQRDLGFSHELRGQSGNDVNERRRELY